MSYPIPISLVVNPATVDTTTLASPVSWATITPSQTLKSGPNVTIFFPASAYKIHINTFSTATILSALPNVVLSDADSYLLLGGSAMVVNGSTATIDTQVLYGATLSNLLPDSSRSTAANAYYVRPGDTFTFPGTTTNIATTNAVVTSVVSAKTCNANSGSSFYIEFSVGVVPATYSITGLSGLNLNELRTSVSPFPGLSRNKLSLPVASASNWTATLSNAVNLVYPNAGLSIPAINPSEIPVVSTAWLKAKSKGVSGAVSHGGTDGTFNAERDTNAGTAPYRCLSVANANAVYQVTVHPMY